MSKWIHVRPQRGGLDAAMAEHRTIVATQEEVDKFFADEHYKSGFKIEHYSDGPDERIDWPNTWIVMHPGGWPAGFASGQVVDNDPTL